MAKREDLALIKSARAGAPEAQLALGTRYLFGGNGLPRSLPTATHWLDRAALQEEPQAWMLIGKYIPLDVARDVVAPENLYNWYERAFDAGVMQAGFVLGQLLLPKDVVSNDAGPMQRKALSALQAAAHAGIPDAQWLLAQQRPQPGQLRDIGGLQAIKPMAPRVPNDGALEWTERAAQSGIAQAQLSLANLAWDADDMDGYLERALPLARERLAQIVASLPASQTNELMAMHLKEPDIQLMSRCARALTQKPDASQPEILTFLELAAFADSRSAQLGLGLWHARMQPDGQRAQFGHGSAQYKKAIRWLMVAAERGSAEARYALSRIYMKSEFSQRNLADMQRHLEGAAQMGHALAQLECGVMAWRNRRDNPGGDVTAAYWLLKAASQIKGKAAELLAKCADRPSIAQWADQALQYLSRELRAAHPLLVARIELARQFGLTRAEALLIDLEKADAGHCLVVDIRAHYSRSRRRLILVDTAEERQLLQRLSRVFENIDASVEGPEGNYRQRLYRLRKVLPQIDAYQDHPLK